MRKINPSGHAVVEFALVFPMLLFLTLVLFDGALLAIKQFALENRTFQQAKIAPAEGDFIVTRAQTNPVRSIKNIRQVHVVLETDHKPLIPFFRPIRLSARRDDAVIALEVNND